MADVTQRVQAALARLNAAAQRFRLDGVAAVVVDGLLNATCGVGSVLLLSWCVPSTFVLKAQYLRFMSRSKAVARLNSLLPLLFVLFAVVAVMESRRKQRLQHRLRQQAQTSTPVPTASPQLLQAHHRILDSSQRMYKALTGLGLALFLNRAYTLVRDNVSMLQLLDRTSVERQILRFKPPSQTSLDAATWVYNSLFSSVLIGVENIPVAELRAGKPLLFVSNHPILALDFPVLLSELHRQTGIFLRALTDRSHWQIPGSGPVMRDILGAVEGNQRNVSLLMHAGQAVLVYPGGARETFKRVGEERYKLHWGNKLGFAKAAIRHGCTIIPCTSVGTEDMTEVLYDLPLGWLPLPFLWGSDRTLPIVKVPRLRDLQRIYFAFGEPIRTDQFNGDCESVANCEAVKQATQQAVEEGITFLQHVQEADPLRHTIRRSPALKAVARLFSDMAAKVNPAGNGKRVADGVDNDDDDALSSL